MIICTHYPLAIGEVFNGPVSNAEREYHHGAFMVLAEATVTDYEAFVRDMAPNVPIASLEPMAHYYRVAMD